MLHSVYISPSSSKYPAAIPERLPAARCQCRKTWEIRPHPAFKVASSPAGAEVCPKSAAPGAVTASPVSPASLRRLSGVSPASLPDGNRPAQMQCGSLPDYWLPLGTTGRPAGRRRAVMDAAMSRDAATSHAVTAAAGAAAVVSRCRRSRDLGVDTQKWSDPAPRPRPRWHTARLSSNQPSPACQTTEQFQWRARMVLSSAWGRSQCSQLYIVQYSVKRRQRRLALTDPSRYRLIDILKHAAARW